MGDSVNTQRWLRAGVGTLALAAIIFYAMAFVVAEGQAVLVMPEVLGHLLVQRGLQDRLGQLLEQPIRAGQRHTLLPGAGHQLLSQLLLRRELRLALLPCCHSV